MDSYNLFAIFYDKFTNDVDYKKRADYFLSLFELLDKKPSLLLDAACGTGSMSIEFAKKGIDVIGVDNSPNMLSNAMQKAFEAEEQVLFLCQDVTELDLYGTIDGAVCTLDSVNHLENTDAVRKFFEKISLFLEKDRLFIFDINTVYKHREILANNYFEIENDGIICQWQNEYRNDDSVKILLKFFEKTDAEYNEYDVELIEQSYDVETIKSVLLESGLEPIAVYDDMTTELPKNDSQRIIIAARKL